MSIKEKALKIVSEQYKGRDFSWTDVSDIVVAYEAAKVPDQLYEMSVKKGLHVTKDFCVDKYDITLTPDPDQPVELPDLHHAVLEDIVRGALESVTHCQSPVACAKAVVNVLKTLPKRELPAEPVELPEYTNALGVLSDLVFDTPVLEGRQRYIDALKLLHNPLKRESGEHKQPDYDSRPDGSGLDDGPELPLSVVIASKGPMIITAYKEGLSARACARVFGVSHDTAATIVRGQIQGGKPNA